MEEEKTLTLKSLEKSINAKLSIIENEIEKLNKQVEIIKKVRR